METNPNRSLIMRQVKVYHSLPAENERMYNPSWDGDWPFGEDHYRLVAIVNIPGDVHIEEAREVAFDATNSYEVAWRERAGVELAAPWPIRSTSVGDVVVIDERAFRVEGAGWTEVTK